MSTYIPAATLDTSYTLPDDGDNITALSVNQALEPLADGIKYCAKRTVVWEYVSAYDETTTATSVDSATWALIDVIVVSFPTTIIEGDVINMQASARFSGGLGLARLQIYGGAAGATQLHTFGASLIEIGQAVVVGQVTVTAAMAAASSASTLHIHFETKKLAATGTQMYLPINTVCTVTRDL